MADDGRIDQRIYLLQKKPKQHRNGKLPDPQKRLSNCQILCHIHAPPFCHGYSLYHIFLNCQFIFVRNGQFSTIIFAHGEHKPCCGFFRNSAQFFHAFFTIRSHFFQRYFRFVRYAESTKTKNPHAPQGCAERRLSICPKYSTMTLHQNPISSHPIPIRTALSSQLPHSRSRPLRHPSRRKRAARPERSLRCFWPVHLWAAAPASGTGTPGR